MIDSFVSTDGKFGFAEMRTKLSPITPTRNKIGGRKSLIRKGEKMIRALNFEPSPPRPGDPVIDSFVSTDGKFGFVEMHSKLSPLTPARNKSRRKKIEKEKEKEKIRNPGP